MAKSKTSKQEPDLNPSQIKFCEEWMVDYNASRAYLAAYPGSTNNTCRTNGSKLLANANIQAYIKFLKTDLERLAGVSKLRTVQELRKLAYCTIEHLHKTWIEREVFEKLTSDQKAAIQSIDTKVLKKNIGTKDEPDIVDVEYVKIQLYDKNKALDALTKMFGYNEPEKIDHTTAGESLNKITGIEIIRTVKK